jgi:hypothetical protein
MWVASVGHFCGSSRDPSADSHAVCTERSAFAIPTIHSAGSRESAEKQKSFPVPDVPARCELPRNAQKDRISPLVGRAGRFPLAPAASLGRFACGLHRRAAHHRSCKTWGGRLQIGPATGELSVPKLFCAKSAKSENGDEIGYVQSFHVGTFGGLCHFYSSM